MKKISLLLFTCITLSLFGAQSCIGGGGISGEGDPVTESFDLDAFSGVVFSIHGDVKINKGPQSFEVTAQKNIIDNLKLEVKNGILHIGFNKNVKNSKSPKFNISMPNVEKLVLSGSGNMKARGFGQSARMKLVVTGSGTLDVDNGGQEMEVKLSGSGNINVSGNAGSGTFGISGSGNILAKELKIDNAEAIVTGSGSIALACKGEMNAKITGSGNIDVYGKPKLVSRITGSGSINEH